SNSSTLSNNTITTSGSTSHGISLSSSNSSTLSNNTITTSGSTSHGISLSSSNSSTLSNNTITTFGTNSYCVYLNFSSNNILNNNKANSSKSNSYVIYGTISSDFNNTIGLDNLAEGKPVNYTYNADNLVFNGVDFTQYGQVIFSWSRNITITNSNFSDDSLNLFYTNTSIISNNNINSTKGYGIYLYSSSNSNTFLNNTITTSGGDGYGIILQSNSNNNVFSKMNIKTSSTNAYAIYIYGNNSFTINDSILNSSLVQEIYVESAVAGGVWNFTNLTRANGNYVNISWTSGSVGTMNVHWYVTVNVTELFMRTVLPDANVTLRDRNNLSVFNLLTDSNGSITPRAVLEYSRNSTLTNYFTPHNLNVTLANYTGYYNSTINLSILLNHQINVQIIDL
ncbi:MAG: right-handed parallel beta-helix repeat-containing protein, partial [Nanoarchaeota archaeon]